ncbi:Cro/Cl family transcriptional regulator [Pseudomonas sp. CDFA 602]|uniref:Cro/CI family transcriptional regulator n=1 Tax=Pseudomonas californiensis TaxID=2829823 RepID=UPI001E3C1511|nr:Cro/CI family transcriptional regulator [Pseudomonas californiensis]MCD5993668.1 Cro/Cl family transcriptional regulator [Pseudomonas californiensis]MCD5999263.1 Cro/Cl family transcriptional regulator [Pseudomonas californiensis]
MNQIPLSELAAQIGQAAVAEAFGITPAAVHKAIRLGRRIIVSVHDDGSYTGHELRPFPSHKSLAHPNFQSETAARDSQVIGQKLL